ncbi:MAG: methyltransferase domain-containing protein [Candidatus Latescibacteria bacterium]|nr:methyltransferase domain-containing protein [Candidatus Latescibacterota bacterium]NIO78566.1 methyltransferase domain-containing protein [Candidatus Latescibacterota bacterium]
MDNNKEDGLPEHLAVKFAMLEALGYRLTADPEILDFGCGAGRSVQVLRDAGYSGWGCDIRIKASQATAAQTSAMQKKIETDSMLEAGWLRLIEDDPYRLPFNDDSFDFVFSEQVLEHVHNYPEMTLELHRIMKPGGACLHFFPSRYQIVERHIKVPLAAALTSHNWLLLWAMLGLRSRSQKELSARETARRNFEFLRDRTNYLPKKQIRRHFSENFENVTFAEKNFLEQSSRGQKIVPLMRVFGFIPDLYSALKNRVLFAVKAD